MEGSGPHLIHGSPGPPKSSTQTAARSVQPFLQGSLVWQTDRQTDRQTTHATRSVRIDRIYVRSTAMRPNNNATVVSSAPIINITTQLNANFDGNVSPYIYGYSWHNNNNNWQVRRLVVSSVRPLLASVWAPYLSNGDWTAYPFKHLGLFSTHHAEITQNKFYIALVLFILVFKRK